VVMSYMDVLSDLAHDIVVTFMCYIR
jgi:hypothetical protein